MRRDLHFAARMLLKQPGFAIIAVLTLGLGIGATSAVFSLIQGVLLTPPAYRDPSRLVLIPAVRSGQTTVESRGWAPLQWLEWQKKAKSFEGIAAYDWGFNFLVLLSGSESLEGMVVSRDYFRVTGLQPILGRTFLPSETDGAHPAPVIILGYDVWQHKFNGDPGIIGRKIHLSRRDTPPVVVGVMPPGVRFLPSPTSAREPNYNPNAQVGFWLPAAPDPQHLKDAWWNVVGRLRPGATPEQAQAELGVLVAQEGRLERDVQGFAPRLDPLTDEVNRDGRRILLPLLGAAALVLLIACGNVAALLLVRGLQRQQEYAVRTALGIGRLELVRQVSTENLLLRWPGAASALRSRSP